MPVYLLFELGSRGAHRGEFIAYHTAVQFAVLALRLSQHHNSAARWGHHR